MDRRRGWLLMWYWSVSRLNVVCTWLRFIILKFSVIGLYLPASGCKLMQKILAFRSDCHKLLVASLDLEQYQELKAELNMRQLLVNIILALPVVQVYNFKVLSSISEALCDWCRTFLVGVWRGTWKWKLIEVFWWVRAGACKWQISAITSYYCNPIYKFQMPSDAGWTLWFPSELD